MKKTQIILLIILILIADQILKIYVKTTFPLNTSREVAGNWFQLYFVENPGMAYGWKFGGTTGKTILTVFRLAAVVFGTWYIGSIIKRNYHSGFIICASLIYAGAIGNLIDSCFYGIIFDKGMVFKPEVADYVNYSGLAKFSQPGYAKFLQGNVVDMLYFPVIEGNFPSWFPFWGGEQFLFFRPIFNIADAAISVGVITIFLFQRRFFRQRKTIDKHQTVETVTLTDDASQMS